MSDAQSDDMTVQSRGDRIMAGFGADEVVEGDWQTMKRLANKILREAENHMTDLQKAEEISGAHVRVSCDCCGFEVEKEWVSDIRDRGATPEEHADHPDFDCTVEDVTVEAFCPRHGVIPLAYDECDDCAHNQQVMNR